jgi:hypothetical protein
MVPEDQNSTLLQSFGAFDLTALRERQSRPEPALGAEPVEIPVDEMGLPAPPVVSLAQPTVAAATPPGPPPAAAPRIAVVPPIGEEPITEPQIDGTVSLLAWDEVAPRAIQALIPVARSDPERLLKHMLDPEEDFAIRRRLVRVLGAAPGPVAFEGLMRALEDQRFEVRYRAGRGLARMLNQGGAGLSADRERVIDAVLREVAVERGLWESRQLVDQVDDDEWSPMETEVLRDRATRSLEHVFTLLSLILPQETLRLAFHGLHTQDPHLRGTALEYLESILPERVREKLWPFLEVRRRPSQPDVTPDKALQQLLASRESIVLALAQARERSKE